MSALKQVFSCFGSQGREGLFQGGIPLSHCRMVSWGTMQSPGIISPSPTQAISLEQCFLSQLLFLTPTSWLQTPITVCDTELHHL